MDRSHPRSFGPLVCDSTAAQLALEKARLVDAFKRRSSARIPALSPERDA
jgi:hypothetical protein